MPAVIEALDEEELTFLLGARPDLAQPPPGSLAELAVRAVERHSVELCYDGLDRGAREVLEALCLLPRPTTAAALLELLGPGAEPGTVDQLLERLAQLVLVLGDGEALDLNPGMSVVRCPAGLGPPLPVALGGQSHDALAEIAHRVGVGAGPSRRSTLAILTRELSDPVRLAGIVRAGPLGTDVVVRRLSSGPPVATGQGGFSRVNDRTPVGWLLRRGLLVQLTWDSVVMPREVALALRGGRPFVPPKLSPPDVAATSVDGATVETAVVDAEGARTGARLIDDIAALLDEWGARPPSLLRDGGLGIRELRRAAKLLDRPERETAVVVELAGMAGLVGLGGADGVALPSPAYDTWASLGPAHRWTAVVRRWLASPFDASLAGAELREKALPPLLDRQEDDLAPVRRRLLLEALAAVPAGSAAPVGAVVARAEWLGPHAWASGPVPAVTSSSWLLEEAALLGITAGGSLAGFGRLLSAGRAEEAAAAFGTALGGEGTEVVFQADLTALAPGRLTRTVRAEMELLADVESSGSATVFRLSETTVRRAFDAGRSTDDLLSFLRGHAARGVPQTLEYLVADVGRRHGHVRVGSARCYLRSDDTALVAEMLAGRKTSRLGLRRLAPTVLVCGQEPKVVMDTLRSAGYLPAQEDAEGGVVVTGGPGRRAVRPLHADPDEETPAAPLGGRMGFDAETLLGLVSGPGRGRALADAVRSAARIRAAGTAGADGDGHEQDPASIAARLKLSPGNPSVGSRPSSERSSARSR